MFDLFFGDKVTICLANDRYHAVVVMVWSNAAGLEPTVEVVTSHGEAPETFVRDSKGVWRCPHYSAKLKPGWIGEYQNPDI